MSLFTRLTGRVRRRGSKHEPHRNGRHTSRDEILLHPPTWMPTPAPRRRRRLRDATPSRRQLGQLETGCCCTPTAAGLGGGNSVSSTTENWPFGGRPRPVVLQAAGPLTPGQAMLSALGCHDRGGWLSVRGRGRRRRNCFFSLSFCSGWRRCRLLWWSGPATARHASHQSLKND